jgi:hypothetical protein
MEKRLKMFAFTAAAVLCVGLANAGADSGADSPKRPDCGRHETAAPAVSRPASEPAAATSTNGAVPQSPRVSPTIFEAIATASAPGSPSENGFCVVIWFVMCCNIEGEWLCGPS